VTMNLSAVFPLLLDGLQSGQTAAVHAVHVVVDKVDCKGVNIHPLVYAYFLSSERIFSIFFKFTDNY
jgi:hypothetical protein